jgi:putative spermidine/putrescine transport system substrate-binding protein
VTKRWSVMAFAGAMLFVVSACGKGGSALGQLTSIGKSEGRLNLIAWGGYVEDGSNDKNFDWIHPFEQQTGCKVKSTIANSSDEMVALMRQGGGKVYDGVSASGDASNRLIAHGDVAPINVSLMPAFKDVIGPLQAPRHNTVGGVHYGVPYMYGVNFLMYNPQVVTGTVDSWNVTFDASSPYKGRITGYDVPIFIADAAMYLKSHQPELGISDPYELTKAQLDAATALLKQQRPLVSTYWSNYLDEISGFENGSMVAGTAWPINLSTIETDISKKKTKIKIAFVVPKEGVTGWADTWMMSSHAQHPNCMYKWMQYTMRPEVQAKVAEWYGAAGSNVKSCDILKQNFVAEGTSASDAGSLVATVRYGECGNVDFLKAIYLWKTPQADCGNGKKDCMDYTVWQNKWNEIKGA